MTNFDVHFVATLGVALYVVMGFAANCASLWHRLHTGHYLTRVNPLHGFATMLAFGFLAVLSAQAMPGAAGCLALLTAVVAYGGIYRHWHLRDSEAAGFSVATRVAMAINTWGVAAVLIFLTSLKDLL